MTIKMERPKMSNNHKETYKTTMTETHMLYHTA